MACRLADLVKVAEDVEPQLGLLQVPSVEVADALPLAVNRGSARGPLALVALDDRVTHGSQEGRARLAHETLSLLGVRQLAVGDDSQAGLATLCKSRKDI